MKRALLIIAGALLAGMTQCGAIGAGTVGGGEIPAGGTCAIADTTPPGAPLHWFAARLETYSDGDPVGTLTDQGTGGVNATQAGADSIKPTFRDPCVDGVINNEPCFDFDGGDSISQVAQTSRAQPFVIAAVVRTDGAGAQVIADDPTSGTEYRLYNSASGHWTYYGAFAQNNDGQYVGEFVYVCVEVNGAATDMRVLTEFSTDDAGLAGDEGFYFGSASGGTLPWDGKLVEFIFYDDTTTGCSDIEPYFDTVYGDGLIEVWPQ